MTGLGRLLGGVVGLVLTMTSPGATQTLQVPDLEVTEIVSGLSAPTNMAFIGPDDILVLEKDDGRVRRVLGGVLQPEAVLDVGVDRTSSEYGLLGIALHPLFPASPYVYLYYTESSTGEDTDGDPPPLGNRVYRYRWDGSVLVEPTLIVALPITPGEFHVGGIITFGPDGKLYVVIGDEGRNDQLQNNPIGAGPDDTSVILRLNDDGSVPDDNPFAGDAGLAKYYAYGIRNSFGMAFDPATGKLWMTENGPDEYDEINLVEPGFNSGWRPIMGPDERDPQGIDDLFQAPGSHYSDPKFSWFTPVGVTAIVFPIGSQLGAPYANDALVGDFVNGDLYRFRLNASRDGFDLSSGLADLVADDTDERAAVVIGSGFGGIFGGITDLKVGPDGHLYVLSISPGKIYRIARVAGASLSASPTTIPAGGAVTATWSGIAVPSPTDWIGLYAPGAADTDFLAWIYVSCTQVPGNALAAGSCPFTVPATLPPGPYELRLLADNGFSLLATSEPLTVTPPGSAPALTASPTTIPAGGAVTATWSGIAAPSPTDWIGLYAPAAADTAFLAWIYVSCTQVPGNPLAAGSCPFTVPAALPPGPYELRLLADNGFALLATSEPLTVTPPGSAPALTAVITGAGEGGGPHVRGFTGNGTPTAVNFLAYSPSFLGGVRVAASDVNGDGFSDVVTGAGPGGGPHVQVFSGADGSLLRSFFAYAPGFTGGVFVAGF